MFFSSCDSVVGDFLEFNQANRGSLCVCLGKRNCSACNAGDPALIPGLGRSPAERNGNLPENSMDRGGC